MRLKRQETLPFPALRIVGVAEFTLMTGRTYDTLLVDLERLIPLEILKRTNSSSFIGWLRAQSRLVE